MMTDITIPIWMLAVSAGVTCISFFSLLLLVLGKIRKPRKELFVRMSHMSHETSQPQNPQFHSSLLASQIDAVFNGLSAIIETERIKMNTLLENAGAVSFDAGSQCRARQRVDGFQPVGTLSPEVHSIQEKIDKITTSGDRTEAIADEMGFSQAEVELALKMRSARASRPHQRLEAVA